MKLSFMVKFLISIAMVELSLLHVEGLYLCVAKFCIQISFAHAN